MIVLDASAAIEVLLRTETGVAIEDRLFASDETIHAPHVIDLEVAQVLRRYSRAGDIDASRGMEALADFADFPLTRYPHDLFLPRIWELRHHATAYDAAYVALAEILAAPLLTRDAKLAASRGHLARIEVL